MRYTHYSKSPVKLSVIIASLLSASCSHFDMRNGFSGDDSPQNVSQEIQEQKEDNKLESKPLPLVNQQEELDRDDPKFILSEAARIAFEEKKYSQATDYWQQLINQYPDYAPAYLGYSQAGRKINAHRNVLANLYQFKKQEPQNIAIITEIAKVHYETQDYRQALEEIDTVINMQDSDWKLYSLRGVINDKLHYYSEAIASYNKALELSPDNPTVLNNMAVSMMMKGKYNEAEEYASRSIENPEVSTQAFKTYAKILAFKGDTQKAQEILTEKLKNKDQARDIINSAKAEISKPSLWGRK